MSWYSTQQVKQFAKMTGYRWDGLAPIIGWDIYNVSLQQYTECFYLPIQQLRE